MSTSTLYNDVIRSVWVALLALTLAVGGWFYLHPHLVADQSAHVPVPAMVEGHEGGFGG